MPELVFKIDDRPTIEMEIPVIESFEIFIRNNDEWDLLYEYFIDGPIYVMEYDERGCEEDSNQWEINNKIKEIITEIRETGTLEPCSMGREGTIKETIFIMNPKDVILKIVGKITMMEKSFLK